MTATPLFTLENIDFSYPGNPPVFRKLSFTLRAHERIGLYGPNGSGKTTLFRLITGLEKPLHGRVLFHGQALEKEKDFHLLRCRVGFVLQNADDQLFCPTVLEDVAFGPLNLGLERQAARDRALHTLHDLGLDGMENRLTHKLSGGEKKLVSIASVLAMQPEALLLDEPTNGLDAEAGRRIIGILQSLPCARITISHDKEVLEQVSTDILTIADGRLVRTDMV
jgi:cobalt/nickel transport system ATP-binding protein